MREHEPFEWKPTDQLRRRYEEPLKMLTGGMTQPGQKQRIVLEYLRDEEVESMGADVSPFEKEKNKIRKILIGSCKLMDPKMEKNGAYEFTPAVINSL